ncbi:MAG: signal peptidase II [Calditrichae bacterium]|nr:signal peptidase II [Calditrichia bacterium]
MSKERRIFVIFGIILLCIAVDQFTKEIAENALKFTPPISYLNGFFVFQYAENSGALLGIFSDLPETIRFWLLTVSVGVLLATLLGYILLNQKLAGTQTIAFSLIIGGGLSNFMDRLFNDGWVIDFMNMGIGSLRTGIFNFADVVIMVGLGIIIVFGGLFRKKETVEFVENETSRNAARE